jgi:hypothetical protein
MWEKMTYWQAAGVGVMVEGGNQAGVHQVTKGNYAYLMEVRALVCDRRYFYVLYAVVKS